MHFYAIYQMKVKLFDKIQSDGCSSGGTCTSGNVNEHTSGLFVENKQTKKKNPGWRYGCRLLTQPIPHLPHMCVRKGLRMQYNVKCTFTRACFSVKWNVPYYENQDRDVRTKPQLVVEAVPSHTRTKLYT